MTIRRANIAHLSLMTNAPCSSVFRRIFVRVFGRCANGVREVRTVPARPFIVCMH
jgi:hypothetical protein